MKSFLVFWSALFSLSIFMSPVGCLNAQTHSKPPSLSLITEEAQLKKSIDKQVWVQGKYTQLNTAMRKDRVNYTGRVELVLKDGSTVVLETDKEGIRSKEEIQKYEGNLLKVKGILHHSCPLWSGEPGSPGPATLTVLYCLEKIEKITPVSLR